MTSRSKQTHKSMKRTYYCCRNIEERYDAFLRKAVDQLSRYLSSPPVEADYRFHQLPMDSKNVVSNILKQQHNIDGFFGQTLCSLRERLRQVSRLFILCSPHGRIAALAQKQSPNARWGISSTQVSATYCLDNEYIVWHEALHLLGAEDCYDLSKGDRGPNCECKNCSMQYAPTKQTVNRWPFLCGGNMDRIRKWILE